MVKAGGTDALGNVPVIAAGNPATIMGQITTTTGSTGTAADLQVAAMQSITVNNSPVLVTIPLAQQSAAIQTVANFSRSLLPAGNGLRELHVLHGSGDSQHRDLCFWPEPDPCASHAWLGKLHRGCHCFYPRLCGPAGLQPAGVADEPDSGWCSADGHARGNLDGADARVHGLPVACYPVEVRSKTRAGGWARPLFYARATAVVGDWAIPARGLGPEQMQSFLGKTKQCAVFLKSSKNKSFGKARNARGQC